jgi:hypothetical protein
LTGLVVTCTGLRCNCRAHLRGRMTGTDEEAGPASAGNADRIAQ